jgi:hypothetical protein
VGRVVEATHVREGAMATFGLLAGLPTLTWDFKLVDVRTGRTLLGTHHRAVGANPFAWAEFVVAQVGTMSGLPPAPEERLSMPAEAKPLDEGGLLWVSSEMPLDLSAMAVRPWRPNTGGAGGLWALWARGMGRAFAMGMAPALTDELAQVGINVVPPMQSTLELGGQVVNPPSRFFTHYQAWLRETGTGREVLRMEVRAPASLSPCGPVAQRVVQTLLRLRIPEPPAPLPKPLEAERWPEVDRLVEGSGAPGLAWVDPTFQLKGAELQVGDWVHPILGKGAEPIDRAFAEEITALAPGWLLGPLAQQTGRGFGLNRRTGSLRLEGRVLAISESDLGNPGTMLGAAFTFGLSVASSAVLQVRIVDTAQNRTVLLVQKQVESYKLASSGTDYKAMKWLAQDLAPWLLRIGLTPEK